MSREMIMQPTRQTHDFVTGSSTGLCWQQVERPNGSVTPCGEPIKSAIHDPAAYLAYSRELRAELREWVAGTGEYSRALPGTPEHEALRVPECQDGQWCRCPVSSPHYGPTRPDLVHPFID